jgi:hypothetical protein
VIVGTNLVTTVVNSASIPSYGLAGNTVTSTNTQFIGAYTKYSEPIVTDGTYYYVNDVVFGYLQKYDSSGSLLNVYSGPIDGYFMTLDGTNLYVSYNSINAVYQYSTSLALITNNLIPGLSGPVGIAADGQGHLFVASSGGIIGEYTTSGAVVNASLITGLSNPRGLATGYNPEPTLNISHANTSVTVSWSAPTNFVLQTNSNLATANWIADTNFFITNGSNVSISTATNVLYYRLRSTNGE